MKGQGPWHGLISSMALARINWWRAAVPCVLAGILFLLLSVLLPGLGAPSVAPSGLTAGTPPNADVANYVIWLTQLASQYTLLFSVLRGIGTPIALVLGINILTVAYFDLRVRRGDFDEEHEVV